MRDVERRGCADNDEKHDHHAADASHQHVIAGVRVLAWSHALLDHGGLQIKCCHGAMVVPTSPAMITA